ncbi:MAG: CAP domain-containing protein [Pyrinomonadaceae bacterium]|nr:CAP domain-containing protein [Pyrinomonadaceae bacterium]
MKLSLNLHGKTVSSFFILIAISALSFVANGQAGTRPTARLITAVNSSPATATRPRPFSARRIDSVSANAELPSAESAHAATPTDLERRAFELINAERRTNGDAPLVWDAALTRVARMHSEEMARMKSLSHFGADGRDMAERAHLFGITGWRALAENIAYNQGYDDPAGFAVECWLLSVKHRENILRSAFTHTAIGVAETADGRIYFTQVFITR